jgi:hypothetical protein
MKDVQIYIIIYSISFADLKYTYEVPVPVDVYDSEEPPYITIKLPCRRCYFSAVPEV